MTSSIQNEIAQMQSFTAQIQSQQEKKTGTYELGQDVFLQLMLEQLKYQDPLEPQGNTEFLSQQAQLTQLTELQKLNKTLSTSNEVQQASSLIDKEVTIEDPDDEKKTIRGVVTGASFTGGEATIIINGKEYPLSSLQSIHGSEVKVDNPS